MGSRPHPSRIFYQAVRRYRAVLALTIIFSLFTNLLLFVGPLYMLQIHDRVLQSRSQTTLLMLTAIAAGLIALYGVLEFLRSRMIARAAMQFDARVAAPAFSLVIDRATEVPTARSRTALADIDQVREFYAGQALLTFCDAPWTPVFLVVCYLFHPLLGLVASSGAALLLALAVLNALLTRRLMSEAAQSARVTSDFAAATLGNVEAIQGLGMEQPILARWLDKRAAALDRQSAGNDRASAFLSLSKLVRTGVQIAILGAGAHLVLGEAISPGVMVAASIMMARALAPVEQSVAHWKSYAAAREALTRLQGLFTQAKSRTERLALPRPAGALSIEGLVAQAPGNEKPVLAAINFALEPGEMCAVIGSSGAGKSTLVRHLIGVARPHAGHVRLDGAEIHKWDRAALGKVLGYLPQDIELFAGTVAENIARFDHQDPAAIVKAARQAGVHELILGFSDGYETEIGEAGRHLSAGQRQRIALARALYGDPALIVLDEPNSNLDSAGDEALAQALSACRTRGQTIVVVTHKPNLLALADKALILSAGRQKGFGSAADLMLPAVAARGGAPAASPPSPAEATG